MGVALVLDERELADPRIGLAQLDAELFGQRHQLLARPVDELGVGREGDVLRLHRGVDDGAGEIGRLDRSAPGRRRQALLQQRLQPLGAHAIAPMGHRGAIERQPVLEELLAAEVLVIRVFEPQLAHDLVAEIIGVLEDREPRHQPRRQRRPAGPVLIDGAECRFQEAPVDRPRQPHQRVIHVDDLIEPRAKQILLAALPPFPWPHRTLRQRIHGRESRPQIRGNPQHEFARKSPPHPTIPANPPAEMPAITFARQSLRDISRTTGDSQALETRAGFDPKLTLGLYSITSLAVASSVSGMVSPIAFAVLVLITSSNFVTCCTGKSAGLSPLRMRPA